MTYLLLSALVLTALVHIPGDLIEASLRKDLKLLRTRVSRLR